MSLRKALKKVNDTITDFKTVKFCSLLGIPLYIGLLIVAVIVAATLGPEGYGINTHFMSDLGDSRVSPAPWIYDLTAIIAGGISIPYSFYMKKLLASKPQSVEEFNEPSELRFRLGTLGLLFSLIGNFGYIGVGIWSADPARENMDLFGYVVPMHMVMSVLVFGGYQFGAFFYGWIILKYDSKIPKAMGVYGVIGPIFGLVLFALFRDAFFEWIMMFLILAWLIPLTLIFIHDEELQLHSR